MKDAKESAKPRLRRSRREKHLTDEERIILAEWTGGWGESRREPYSWKNPKGVARKLQGGIKHAKDLPAFEADPREYMPIFEQLAGKPRFALLEKNQSSGGWRVTGDLSLDETGDSPGEAICKAALTVLRELD